MQQMAGGTRDNSKVLSRLIYPSVPAQVSEAYRRTEKTGLPRFQAAYLQEGQGLHYARRTLDSTYSTDSRLPCGARAYAYV